MTHFIFQERGRKTTPGAKKKKKAKLFEILSISDRRKIKLNFNKAEIFF